MQVRVRSEPASRLAVSVDVGQEATYRASDAFARGLAGIAAGRTPGAIYRAACGLAARLGSVSSVALLRPDDRGLFGVAYATPPAMPRPAIDAASAALHQRWIAAHAPGEPSTGPGTFAVEGQPPLLVVPLVRGDSLLGALVLAGAGQQTPASTPAERMMIGAIGVVTAQALEGIVLRQRLDVSISRAEHERELTAARKEIGRELHDGPTQDLALAGLTLDRLIKTLGEDQATAADARQARDLIDRAILGMRKAIGKLRSSQPPAPSITGPLRELLAEMAPTAPGLEVNFDHVSGVRLAPEIERAIVGIVREALHNVRKHAQADRVQLEVRRADGAIEIEVADDGVGFEGAAPAGHFGLEQIKELAEETGGRLEVGSKKGSGTTVKAWIPLPSGTTGTLKRQASDSR